MQIKCNLMKIQLIYRTTLILLTVSIDNNALDESIWSEMFLHGCNNERVPFLLRMCFFHRLLLQTGSQRNNRHHVARSLPSLTKCRVHRTVSTRIAESRLSTSLRLRI